MNDLPPEKLEVELLPCHNSLKNVMHLIVGENRQALCIDPFDAGIIARHLDEHNLHLEAIINTHEHWDHIHGNQELQNRYGSKILSVKSVENADQTLLGGETLDFAGHKIEVFHIPGHTMNHIGLKIPATAESAELLFCGDTLFNAGVGHCRIGGDPHILFQTYEDFFADLSDGVTVYPGHDYILNNLQFAKKCEPSNSDIDELTRKAKEFQANEEIYITTMGEERKVNPFLRLENEEIRQLLPNPPSSKKDVFLQLRQLRDQW